MKQGLWYGAPPPYGYEIEEGKLTPHPVESKWVKKMFRCFYDGKTIIWIKSQLDKQGVTVRRGGLFNTGSINVLLQNTHHIGRYAWSDKRVVKRLSVPALPSLMKRFGMKFHDAEKKSMPVRDRITAPRGSTYFAI